MCIIVDAGCIAVMFDPGQRRHKEFQPVLKWITEGKGRMVFGGATYKAQLGKLARYLGVIAELKKAGRVATLRDEDVDSLQLELNRKISDTEFDDAHLIAIAVVGKIMLICTQDKRACRYIKDKTLYPKGSERPKIYMGLKNRGLLANKYITGVCKE